MRPDWLVIGELCGAEAVYALQLLGRGFRGLTTVYATSVEDALMRLETMCLMAKVGLGRREIRRLIASALRLITYQEKLPVGRRILQITELCGVEGGRYVLHPLWDYDPAKDCLEATANLAQWRMIE
jgi:Flp pilus assembly CpaF family ATPase